MPWLLQAAPQADGSWWAMAALQHTVMHPYSQYAAMAVLQQPGRALQLEWEEPFSATYNTYKMLPTLSIRQYKTQGRVCSDIKFKQSATLQELLRQD